MNFFSIILTKKVYITIFFNNFIFNTKIHEFSSLFLRQKSSIQVFFLGFCLKYLTFLLGLCQFSERKKKDLNSYNFSGSHTWDLVSFTCRSLRTGEHTWCQVRLGQNRYDSKSLNILQLYRCPR